MATLMTHGDSDGRRRCDARCYDAKSPECDCICGGHNHGAGLKQAVENTREIAEAWLAAAAEAGNAEARILLDQFDRPQQLTLF